ncbi:MAG TPA: sugar phosphate isomerase/epimerase [Ktedonobacteraceae bacterium]|jgi:sugar phosphate isomerase/epimerase|nr:sugar phosphate isomerase/epimerase [Ktedonobacteraceae bacterium]
MIRLSAFADEISPDIDKQIDVLIGEGIAFVDLRSAWGTNVLDLSDEQVITVKQKFDAKGIGVAAIGSPIGKVPVDTPRTEYLQRFERALTVAKMLDSKYIRLFSFYAPTADGNKKADPASYREGVVKYLQEMTAIARAANIVLVHENEKEIYGDVISRNVDLYQSINDAHFRAVLDPANYLQCQQTPYPDAYDATRPWLEYVHVKDVRADGTLVVAGEGEGHWPELLRRLRDDRYDGFLALEPHLAAAGQYQGFSGPDLFRSASQALQKLLREMDWKYA